MTSMDLTAAGGIPHRPRTRFAPSPTGLLHLGHVAHAVYVWGIARRFEGSVVMRVEDHDRGRSRPAFETEILRDLEWLGLEPDVGVGTDGVQPEFRQSDCHAHYQDALESLQHRATVYACDCTRRAITRAGRPDAPELRYPGRCRPRGLPGTAGTGLRLVMEPGTETFTDVLLGPQTQSPADQCGDLLLRDRAGNWTYHFAVAVDDARHGIDLVIRGADLLTSTGRQIRLARLLGRSAPATFLHHPLLRGPDGEKLSKRNGDLGLRALRARGETPAQVLGRAACQVGLLPRAEPLAAAALAELFS